MNLTRRQALKIIAAGLLAPALPVPRPQGLIFHARMTITGNLPAKGTTIRLIRGGSRSGKTLDLINPKVLTRGW